MGAQFIAEGGPLKGLVLALDEGDEWIMGRDIDQCNLLIEDLTASRRHLLCRKTEEGYFIENLSETHPVLVNGKTLENAYLLQEGDLIKVGSSFFRFYQQSIEDQEFLEPFSASDQEKYDTIYEEETETPIHLDLSLSSRFLVKVIAGPNVGAEFALEPGATYTLGTDSTTCDIIFHDLSVSREHGRITISPEGEVTIEDLDSRNGIIVDRERIISPKRLLPNTVVTVGTTSFLLLDREAEAVTIAAPLFQPPPQEEEEAEPVFAEKREETENEKVMVTPTPQVTKAPLNRGTLILSLSLAGLAILFGLGILSLFRVSEVTTPPIDYMADIHDALQPFPGVKYTYNPATNKLFLVGHVLSGVKKSELLYNIKGLTFLKGIEDNVVDDEAVWQEMNLLLVKHADFKGVSMHAPKPGLFVLTGYLQTEKQSADLMDYMNVHFNYLSLLENRVVVDEDVMKEVMSSLIQQGFGAVNVTFANGELLLTGYVSSTQMDKLKELIGQFEQIHGIRFIKNFVVAVSPEQGVIDLNKRYPDRYQVTGYSKHGNVNLNVVINGRILTRGDQIEGMIITSIQPKTIFLEKDGLKYKLNY